MGIIQSVWRDLLYDGVSAYYKIENDQCIIIFSDKVLESGNFHDLSGLGFKFVTFLVYRNRRIVLFSFGPVSPTPISPAPVSPIPISPTLDIQ